MDRLSEEKRSWLMSRVSSKDTAPELRVRKALHSKGYRYRIHLKDLPGKPDIVFTRKHKAIFIHGCFWHGHDDCKYGRLPKSRVEFWSEKVTRNRVRDDDNSRKLEALGWKVLVVWQCELKDFENALRKIDEFLEGKQSPHRH